jgi:hypothetical protein
MKQNSLSTNSTLLTEALQSTSSQALLALFSTTIERLSNIEAKQAALEVQMQAHLEAAAALEKSQQVQQNELLSLEDEVRETFLELDTVLRRL